MVAGIIVYSITCPLPVNAATVFSEVPVGIGLYSKTDVQPLTDLTIFSNKSNTAGIHLRTVVVSCLAFSILNAIGPEGDLVPIGYCSPTAQIGVEQIYGIFLPDGWGLMFSTLGPSFSSGRSSIYITYDKP
jgi:hypothetical protein